MRNIRSIIIICVISLFILIPVTLTRAVAITANVSHSYSADLQIIDGSIVSFVKNDSGHIELANTQNGTRLLGVSLPSNQSLIAVDPSKTSVQVAISGIVNVLVSTVDGDIKVGDQISVSPFSGIGMKASSGKYVVGVAQTEFNYNSSGANIEKVKDVKGKTNNEYIGLIRLSLAVGTNGTAAGGGQQINLLQKLVKSLTGHTIPTLRILLAVVVVVVSFVTLVTLVYASVYGSIISIGRNPLAKYAVYKTLFAVMMAASLIIILASLTVYFLLK